ncbi:MAG: CvpA family protein [Candidatus Hydrogenedentota bacterium]
MSGTKFFLVCVFACLARRSAAQPGREIAKRETLRDVRRNNVRMNCFWNGQVKMCRKFTKKCLDKREALQYLAITICRVNFMTIIDIILLIIAVFFVYRGYKRGLIRELLGLIALFFAVIISVTQYGYIADILNRYISITNNTILKMLSIFILFVAIEIFFIIAAYLLKRIIEKFVIGKIFNRFGGMIFGFIKISLIILFITTYIFYIIPGSKDYISERSKILAYFEKTATFSMDCIYYLAKRYPYLVNNRFIKDHKHFLSNQY